MARLTPRGDLERRINQRTYTDPEFKAKLLQSPKECLTEFGLNIPSQAKIVVHQEDENTWHLVLRQAHPARMSEEELQSLAAGNCYANPDSYK